MGGGAAAIVTLCIVLDSFGPWSCPVAEQPERLLQFLADKRAAPTKREAFFPSIEAAADARVKGKDFAISKEVAMVFIGRSLKPAERIDEHGSIHRGFTWRWDRMVRIFDILLDSDAYCQAFISRIACPWLALLSTNGFQSKLSAVTETRTTWLTACPSVTVRIVEGSHHFHLEDAPMAAREISEWICAQDKPDKARM
ncbi:hypothetical protein DFQ27_001017 [Actinomortierella ambigua]|uniref:Alpha/beta hydrolase n=1 Tax=Actinomortierella ambigua TaxID=1343610 RepID=A0A9P6U948_9FUNG|nr:hypothetical protein DFQ27_001017 [Actinomortierella ambigua]